jgi:hypothetical protein
MLRGHMLKFVKTGCAAVALMAMLAGPSFAGTWWSIWALECKTDESPEGRAKELLSNLGIETEIVQHDDAVNVVSATSGRVLGTFYRSKQACDLVLSKLEKAFWEADQTPRERDKHRLKDSSQCPDRGACDAAGGL